MTEELKYRNLDPDAPASQKQKVLLKLAIAGEWINPNPFEGAGYEKWKNLTAGEADILLSSIPPERLGVLEKEAEELRKTKTHPLAERAGRETEEMVREIGRQIDGGF